MPPLDLEAIQRLSDASARCRRQIAKLNVLHVKGLLSEQARNTAREGYRAQIATIDAQLMGHRL